MSRFLLVLCLFLYAAASSAGDVTSGEAPAKPGKTTTAASGQDADAVPSVHSAAAQPRAGAPRTPRWHSLLPGMIR